MCVLQNKACLFLPLILTLIIILKIKQKVIVAVNGDEEKGLDHVLFDGDKLLVFTLVSGG